VIVLFDSLLSLSFQLYTPVPVQARLQELPLEVVDESHLEDNHAFLIPHLVLAQGKIAGTT
jgi:hypothetical protein